MGVYREELDETMAGGLHRLGCKRGFVVHGRDGMDEITLTGETAAAEVSAEGVRLFTIAPEEFGFSRCSMQALKGGDAAANAAIVRAVLTGEQGPRREIVLMNAAYALLAAGRCATVAEGVTLATQAIDSGAALKQIEKLATLTN
jgi:anthranilate phosphoribosyltransferase